MKKGSALLIVLGMMAFIMVSALAFSAYMRYARLPSSYLRRTSSSRLLAKAAVARAIDDIDRAVGNNPHPGVGTSASRGNVYNTWRNRVMMGTQNGSEVSPDKTVTPLCLEALAYMPPPLVNAARYYSRRAATAQWQSLGFDVGRYCFCALDVSDYFDVNRMMADTPRSSSPQRRVSMAYIFEDDSHRGPGSGGSSWDQFMDDYRSIDENTLALDFNGKDPLVSLADFNLVLGRKGSVAGFTSPFYDYLTSGGARAGFYNTSGEADEERIRRMTFVTDGWFPQGREPLAAEGEEESIERHDLNDGQYQPFAADFLKTEKPALSDVVMGTRILSNGTMQWLNHLSGIGCAALYDYLDPDHVPISLAVPTTERVPMICGIETVFPGSKLAIMREPAEYEKATPTVVSEVPKASRVVQQKVTYRIDAQQFLVGFGGHIKALVTFPFAHPDPDDSSSFNLDGKFSMFFTSDEMPLRTGEMNDVLHLTTPMIANTAYDGTKGVINVKIPATAVAFNGKIDTEEQAVKEIADLRLTEGMKIGADLGLEGNALLTVTYEWTQTPKVVGGVMTSDWTPSFAEMVAAGGSKNIKSAHCGMPALLPNGTADPDFADAKILAALQGGGAGAKKMILNAAVWLRVLDQKGKIVDMVPACTLDDKFQNMVNDPVFGGGAGGNFVQKFAGQHFPLMRLDTGVEFKLAIADLDALIPAPKEVKLSPSAMMVADPRYNYAPEHWFQVAGGGLSVSGWLEQNLTGSGERDDDIFMATSDAGYMQSPYEVAHLPRFTDLVSYEKKECGSFYGLEGASLKSIPQNQAAAVNQQFMWRTYDPFGADRDAFRNKVPWKSEGTGFKVNPYSDSTNILMAAFANTPVDWKRASTNDQAGAEDYAGMSASEFNRKYAMNEYSSDTKVAWQDLENIAGRFMQLTRQRADWKRAWDEDMDWYYDPDNLCGVRLGNDTDNLWTHDRKFLYGYWRECFGTQQQLFLVFVRAEPMMMGSGAVGQIPPQLGARAVALVWRDPTRSRDNSTPHQTRILFYRQFE